MIETWKSIPGYEGIYEVSDQGRVRSLRSGQLMKIGYTRGGYKSIGLSSGGYSRQWRVNRLVLIAFLGDQPHLQAAHKDGVRTDNSLSNLYWATTAENAADRVRHGTNRKGEDQPMSILTEDDVRRIRKDRASDTRHTLAYWAAWYGIAESTVARAANGKTWRHI